ncbi:futalosine hydrolase [Ferruginibacter yonginensis]|uniref:Futalosine hydrolase n=1 Tax=Ferruginibacter yonginensis TaxID=1310416 RepID=A0ABV8QTM2_9BACT
MKILVVAATAMEIAPFIAQQNNVEVLITGVGAPACMYKLTQHLLTQQYNMVIQAGIAGTFKNSIALGDTVLVKNDVFADLGIYERDQFFTLFEKGFIAADEQPYKNGWLHNHYNIDVNLPWVNAITVNTVSDQITQTNLFLKKFDADIETMEGAAFHYVCLQQQIPFLQLRSISNYVGERVKTNWKIKESITSLNHHLQQIITQLQSTPL